MGYTERLDVLDLIIEVLRSHERVLDGLIARLEKIVGGFGGPAQAA